VLQAFSPHTAVLLHIAPGSHAPAAPPLAGLLPAVGPGMAAATIPATGAAGAVFVGTFMVTGAAGRPPAESSSEPSSPVLADAMLRMTSPVLPWLWEGNAVVEGLLPVLATGAGPSVVRGVLEPAQAPLSTKTISVFAMIAVLGELFMFSPYNWVAPP
jgi:hypothetical protein